MMDAKFHTCIKYTGILKLNMEQAQLLNACEAKASVETPDSKFNTRANSKEIQYTQTEHKTLNVCTQMI